MSIYAKLSSIQAELKAPKGQYNNFGKYKYRSCEDILEAIKPLLTKYKCALTLNDEIEQVGERYYIRATITLHDTESDKTAFATALAREEETKKGMDGSQITGTASSYARKYALNGLFAIDDTKDSDALPPGDEKEKPKNKTTTPTPPPKVSDKDKIADIGKKVMEMVHNDKTNAKKMLKVLCNVDDLKKLTTDKMIEDALRKTDEAYKEFKGVK